METKQLSSSDNTEPIYGIPGTSETVDENKIKGKMDMDKPLTPALFTESPKSHTPEFFSFNSGSSWSPNKLHGYCARISSVFPETLIKEENREDIATKGKENSRYSIVSKLARKCSRFLYRYLTIKADSETVFFDWPSESSRGGARSSCLCLTVRLYTTMAATMEYYKEQANKILHEKNKFTDVLAQIEAKTQVKREYLASGALVLLGLYLVFGYGAQLICNVIAFIYPAYCSIKVALETPRKEDDTRWLTYWVVFAFFSVTEFFSDLLLSWFPFYWLAKCMFLVWCFLPLSWNGSDMIYSRVIRPAFIKNQTQIDKAMGKVTDKIGELADNVTHIASDAIKSD